MTYIKKVQGTIDYIEEHIRDEVDLEYLANSTEYSMWHYQRVFKACTGHAMGEYLAKRRLCMAANELKSTDKSILDIAIEFRFGSHEAFSRAFKRYFNSTPKDYRNIENACLNFPRLRINTEYLNHLYKGVSMSPDIKKIDTLTVVGVSGQFTKALDPETNNMEIIPQLWGLFFSRMDEIKNISGPTIGAISSIDGAPKEMNYIAGIVVVSALEVPDGMTSIEIPKGKYAEFVHQGPVSNIDKTLNYIYGSWLPSSKYQRTDGPEYEVYPKNYEPESDSARMSLRIPVRG